MNIRFHPHALERMEERDAEKKEVIETIESGEQFPAKFGRTGFRRNFSYAGTREGKEYRTKQLEVFAVEEDSGWLILTVITKFF